MQRYEPRVDFPNPVSIESAEGHDIASTEVASKRIVNLLLAGMEADCVSDCCAA
jgi:hypothetical protein